MPKEAFEIKSFDVGVATSPSSRDVAPNAAVHSENIDSLTEQGKLVPIPGQTNWINYTGTDFAELQRVNQVGERDLIIYDNSGNAGNLNLVSDVYEFNSAKSLDGAIGSLGNQPDVNFVTNNSELHIGGTSNSFNLPATAKSIIFLNARTQFNTGSTTGYNLFDSECHNPDDFLTITVAESTQNAVVPYSDAAYHYAFSVVYDEYQESPLYFEENIGINTWGRHAKVDENSANNNTNKGIQVTIAIDTGDTKFTKRITNLRVYRGTSPRSQFKAVGFYRLVKDFNLMTYAGASTNGNTKTITFHDLNEELGTSYEDNTGIPQTLETTHVNYKLSEKLDNSLFIADCMQSDIGFESQTYIFKSKPYRFNTFDWTLDYVRIDFLPTALASFLGKLYVFGENKMIKVNPQTLVVEDEFDGVGCLNQNCVLVTEYGMAIADDRNIYLHNGSNPAPISNVINEGSNYSWQNRLKSYDSFMLFDSKRNSIITFFQTDLVQGDEQWAWAYNISQSRWDLYKFGNTVFKGGYNNKDGDVVIADSNSLEKLFTSTTELAFTWQSGDLNIGTDSQRKIFFKIYVFGTGYIDVQYSIDKGSFSSASSVNASTLTNEANGITLPANARKGKTIAVKVSGTNGEKVDSIAIVLRKLSIK